MYRLIWSTYTYVHLKHTINSKPLAWTGATRTAERNGISTSDTPNLYVSTATYWCTTVHVHPIRHVATIHLNHESRWGQVINSRPRPLLFPVGRGECKGSHWTGSCAGPRNSLGVSEKEKKKSLTASGIAILEGPVPNPVTWLRWGYSYWA